MPRVKLDYVVSFSSEDPENQASNLLAHEVSKKKWLCSAGEPSCSVVLQLARSVQIATVHIGAYHAAFVEVLVGRSETPNDKFEVLVPRSVFLPPAESRRGGGGAERVRSFSGAQLAARGARWDRVRVVCSQPYNKHCKYGLSFIHIFEPEDGTQPQPEAVIEVPKPAPAVPPRMMAIDNFSSDEDDFKPGELFAQHQKRISDAGSSDTGAQIRQATLHALKNIPDASTKLVKTPTNKPARPSPSDHVTDRRRESLLYTDDDQSPHSRIGAIVQRHKKDKEEERKKKEPPKGERQESKLANSSRNFRDFIDDNDNGNDLNNSRDGKSKDVGGSRSKDNSKDDRRKDLNSRSDDRGNKDDERTPYQKADSSQNKGSKKRPHPDEKQNSKEVLRPGPVTAAPHTLLREVVFALSGYENPRRAGLRDAAQAMGALFQRDWSPACTHLICAFPNTPKLRSVRASDSACIAVTGEWVEACCARRRLLPWQWFATEPRRRVPVPAAWEDDAAGASTGTECDTDDEIEKVLRKQKRQRIDSSPRNASPKPHTSREVSPKPHTKREMSPKPHTSREISPRPHTSREMTPKSHTSREVSLKPHTSREVSPKPHTSREMSPKPHTSSEKAPKSDSNEEATKKGSAQNSSNLSNISDLEFIKDERIQGNITVNSDSDQTDEEKPVLRAVVNKKSVLPDFFEGYTFLIDERVEEAGFDVDLLGRYVRAYGGVLVDASQVDSESEISYVLAADRDAKVAGGRRVRPDWVWRCHERRQLCDADEFAL